MDLLTDDDEGWDRAAELLASGRIVALPTDTVYGVAAPISTPGAVARLFPLKARDVSKPVAVLVAEVEQAGTLVSVLPVASLLADRFWPGALTMVLPRSEAFDVDLGGAGETVGVRCPDHDRLRELCRRLGPLATTSANRSGHPTPETGAEVAVALDGTEVAAVVDGGRIDGSASTVVRVVGGELTVLREGPIAERELGAVVAHLA
jgi:tRNA threonylcarbamoyl adenosine modification protein (Sua5/YciO/YrdC/YwlC family)